VVDSTLEPGALTYGEIVLPGREAGEVLLSTYVCHPSLANNELSGPVVATALARWISALPDRRYTYRIVFAPETIGAITYLSRHLDHLRRHVVAAFNMTCVGDDRAYSYLASRAGDTLADRVAVHVLGHLAPGFVRYSFLDRHSDERQYCAPGVDLPMATMMRTAYGRYPEYHTSEDDLTVISPDGLSGAYEVLRHCLLALEGNDTLRTTTIGEPQLGRRGLMSTLGHGPTRSGPGRRRLANLLAYSDGTRDLLGIAELTGEPIWDLFDAAALLRREGLLA
jgi:aminopeptidase-like protein